MAKSKSTASTQSSIDSEDRAVSIDDARRLQRLLTVPYPCVQMVTNEEEYALGLVREAAINLGRGLWQWSVIGGIRNGIVSGEPALKETENPAVALYTMTHFEGDATKHLCVTLDLAPHLRDERVLRALRELITTLGRTNRQLVMIESRDELPESIGHVTRRFRISLPSEAELEEIVVQTLRTMHQQRAIEIDISRGGLKSIIRNLQGLSRQQAELVIIDTVSDERRLSRDDVATVLAHKRDLLHRDGLLGCVNTPTDLSEVGGLRRLKNWLSVRRAAGTARAVEFGLAPPRGVLLLGVQGAGKSLCAKAIATAWELPLLRLDPGVLYDRFVGESERRLREALSQTEAMAPNVLWIDEIEKAFASAASRSADGGLSQRMFGSLLTWLQEHTRPVFVVATANDIEALPPELLRKGRFDEIFFVDLPGPDARRDIFTIHLRKRKRDPAGFDLDALVAASHEFSGAEIEQAVMAGMYKAFGKSEELATRHVLDSLRESPPLSATLAEKVGALRAWAAGRCVPAD